VLAELKAGMDFGVEAKLHSTDSTAEDGGYMGRLRPDGLRAELSEGLKGLKSGQFSGVVRLPSGFAILTVFAKAPDRPDLDKKRIAGMASSSAVRQSVVVSGNGEAKSVFDQFAKPEGWARDLAGPCAIRKQSMPDAIGKMVQLLKEANAQPAGEVPPRDLLEGYTALAELYAYIGEMEKSIDAWKRVAEIAEKSFPASLPYLQETLGVSYLHWAEMENQIFQGSSSMDIFPPINPMAHFAKQDHAKEALAVSAGGSGKIFDSAFGILRQQRFGGQIQPIYRCSFRGGTPYVQELRRRGCG
jgi:tetratricopeptide (TPR) repeat protein